MDDRAAALEALYRRRYGAFLRTLSVVTGSYDAAHDAVQESFARALRARETLRSDEALESWLWRIALRTAAERRTESHARLNGSEPDAMFVQPERDVFLAEAVRSLPPRRRLIVFLRYFADLTYAEIAAIMGVTEGAVAATLAQAHEALRVSLEREGVER
ncbi:MAG: sigma-70 family RNA polymerase sigma factor [Thermoleophilia bacterium]|nr:sigma-70 family RNA polymerase sigma factor [Thermoleophilia bacterium]